MTSACLVLYLQMASPQKRRKSKPSKMPANLQTLQKSEVFSVSLTTALITFLTLPPSPTRLDSQHGNDLLGRGPKYTKILSSILKPH